MSQDQMQFVRDALAGVFAFIVFSLLVPTALATQQTVTNSTAKPGQKQPGSPSRTSVVVKGSNPKKAVSSATSTNAKSSQPTSPSSKAAVLTPIKPNQVRRVLPSSNAASKLKDSKVTAVGAHQYVITASDSGTFHQVAVRVLNNGKAPAKAGRVYAEIVVLEQGSDPRKSKILWVPGEIIDFLSSPMKTQPYYGAADVPSLKPGETADVYVKFDKIVNPEQLKLPLDWKWTMGVNILAYNNESMADGTLSAYLLDFLSYGFFNP